MNLDAQKMVNALAAQRNSALDSAAQLAAMLESANEEIAKLNAKVQELEAKIAVQTENKTDEQAV
jgi:chromosome segregation ATPase